MSHVQRNGIPLPPLLLSNFLRENRGNKQTNKNKNHRQVTKQKNSIISTLFLQHPCPLLLRGLIVGRVCSSHKNRSRFRRVTSCPLPCWAALTRILFFQYVFVSWCQKVTLAFCSFGRLPFFQHRGKSLLAFLSAPKPPHPSLPPFYLQVRAVCLKGWHSALSISHGSCSDRSSHPPAAQPCQSLRLEIRMSPRKDVWSVDTVQPPLLPLPRAFHCKFSLPLNFPASSVGVSWKKKKNSAEIQMRRCIV